MKPDFDQALQGHLDAISHRDLDAFKSNFTRDETLYTIVKAVTHSQRDRTW